MTQFFFRRMHLLQAVMPCRFSQPNFCLLHRSQADLLEDKCWRESDSIVQSL